MNSGNWTTIPVPSNWELEGFGSYNYGYDKTEGRADEKGIYRYTFSVPKHWENKIIKIVFEGVMTDAEVKINGKQAGPMHQGAFYRFKYNITDLLQYGSENLIEVTVSKVSANVSVNKAERKADYWIFGGIFRPVYLEVLPETHISQMAINAAADGELTTDIIVRNLGKKDEITIQLYNLDGEVMHSVLGDYIKREDLVLITGNYEDIKLWSPESPNLYKLVITLKRNEKILHIVEQKIGFRSIEVKERDGVYLNGVKIKFKGVNRHCFYPSTGRTLSRKQTLEDVLLIKDMNMNAVRNSHYPADDYFYSICDSLGIMVLDELGGWHDAYDTGVGTKLVKETIYKSMNHPCVVMWVNGNEGGHNRELLYLYDSIDIQKRPVLHAWENFGGLDTQHYRDYNYGVGNHYQGHDIVMPTEFLHGLYDGGHGAGLEDFWNLMWNNPLSAGGFLWNLADEAVVRTDRNGELDSDGNHGADGILGPYHEKEGSYFTIKEVWSPVYFEHREVTPDFDGAFRIENRYHFTNLNQCKFSWELMKYSMPGVSKDKMHVSGEVQSPNIQPLEKGKIIVSLPEEWKQFDVLYITAKDKQGKEIFTWSWPIILPKELQEQIVVEQGEYKVSVDEQDAVLNVRVDNLKVKFSKKSGLILGIENSKGPISFTNGPVLCEGESEFKELTYQYEEKDLLVEAVFTDESVYKTLKWTIFSSGWMRLDVVYSPVVERHEIMGISFSYPEEFIKGIRWMGDGPYRVWKNRMKGNKLGVWEKDYNNTITGQSEYIYPEFKGYHSNMYWLKIISKEQSFTVVTPDEDIFFRVYTPGTPKDPYNTAPKFPSGDISFMHGITSIGTKSLQTFRMGPMSEENIYYSYGGIRPKRMVLYFDFRGKL
jgi:hypothetical protein